MSDYAARLADAIEKDYPQMPIQQRAHIALTLAESLFAEAERHARSEAVRECAPAHAILWGASKWPYCICGEGSTLELHPDRLMLHLKQQAILALDKGGEE